ncbi:MAG: hypothetical protein HN580_30170 [Deltaproteobacteria bacterium]|jgi:heme-degrading monooxygenase HmoA|nr:hypothetical protein [Deltaproteobacteria bacterium]MBT4086877.1 hypothetical protein [Deltaproteobacteria bacterium]MBT4265831.1 hypothetical protein [Deltaproteobacteria bacterium]MBT4637610.1 hypothetical protein [Deltaproteobacteria bacterium]MBT6503140.1 hypothetical protein [Deltaproteobacteria bacterium]
MAIKVFIERQLRDPDYKQAARMINDSRTQAMDQNGYIGSETLWSNENTKTVMIMSIWQNVESWKAYLNSPARKKLEDDFEKIMTKPAEYAVFHLGTHPDFGS